MHIEANAVNLIGMLTVLAALVVAFVLVTLWMRQKERGGGESAGKARSSVIRDIGGKQKRRR